MMPWQTSTARRRPVAALAERVWRIPFVLAAVVMVAAGVAHAVGQSGVPGPAALAALVLVCLGTPLGLLALRSPSTAPPPADPSASPSKDQP